MLVENNEVTIKRERKQVKSTPDTQEIYKHLQMVIVDGNTEKKNEEICFDSLIAMGSHHMPIKLRF